MLTGTSAQREGFFCPGFALGRGPPRRVDTRGDGRRVRELGLASAVRRTQYRPTRVRKARAGLTDGQIVKEEVRDLGPVQLRVTPPAYEPEAQASECLLLPQARTRLRFGLMCSPGRRAAAVGGRRATPPGLRPPLWGLAGSCRLDPTHATLSPAM